MRIYILMLFLVFGGCKSSKSPLITMPKNEYRLVKNASEDIESLKKSVSKSEVILEMNFETGSFKGKYEKINFEGKYTIVKVTSGLSKGFNYEIDLESMSSDPTESKAEEKFIQMLATCKSMFIGPDRLYNPTYIKISIRTEVQSENFYLLN
jgi:hypothetical protein